MCIKNIILKKNFVVRRTFIREVCTLSLMPVDFSVLKFFLLDQSNKQSELRMFNVISDSHSVFLSHRTTGN